MVAAILGCGSAAIASDLGRNTLSTKSLQTEDTNLVSPTKESGDRAILLAQAEPRESPWICGMVGEEWADEAYFETRNFYLNICHKKNGSDLLYVGTNKKTGATIKLPASVPAKGGYIAENGDIAYVIQGNALNVYNKNRLVSQERIVKSAHQ